MFCGTVGSLSDEHVVPKWVRKALQIREPVREFSGAAYVGAAETLAIVFHEVCVSCNTGWMESLERDACPVLGPGERPGRRQRGPAQPGGELALFGGGGLGAQQLLQGVQCGQLAVAGGVEDAGQGFGGGGQLEVGQVAAQPLVGGRRVVRGGVVRVIGVPPVGGAVPGPGWPGHGGG